MPHRCMFSSTHCVGILVNVASEALKRGCRFGVYLCPLAPLRTFLLRRHRRPVVSLPFFNSSPKRNTRLSTQPSSRLSMAIVRNVLLLAAAATALWAKAAEATTTSTLYPGRCTKTSDCTTYGTNMVCVAVDSNIAGLEDLSMCVASSSVCSGRIAGTCPSFTSWPSKYRKVQPVCAFTAVTNCTKVYNVTVSGDTESAGGVDVEIAASSYSGSLADNQTVECWQRNFSVNGAYKVVKGAYGCMDVAKYLSTNGGQLTNLTQSILTTCGAVNNSGSYTLCNAEGTCGPEVSFAQDYACSCNSGYNSTDYCSSITSNDCSNLGQCGSYGTCTLTSGSTNGTCTCKSGATGNQCSLCDPTVSTACSSHGTCSSSGVCTCNSGYNGTFCDTTVSGSSSSSTNSNGAASVSGASSTAMLLVLATLGLALWRE